MLVVMIVFGITQVFAATHIHDILRYQLPEYDLVVMKHEVPQSLFFDISLFNPSSQQDNSQQDNSQYVDQVSFLEAVQFANQLSQHEGLEPCYQIDRQDIFWMKGYHCTGWRLATHSEWAIMTHSPLPQPEEVDRVLWYINPNSTHIKTSDLSCEKEFQLCGIQGGAWEWLWDEIRVSNDVKGDFLHVRTAVGGDFHLKGDPAVVYRFQLKENFSSPYLTFRLVRSEFH